MEVNLITFVAAFFGGMAGFFSPCVLPLVPAYLLCIGGTSAKDAQNRARTFIASIGFVLGVALIFSILGATGSLIGALLLQYHEIVEKVAGIVIILLGMRMMYGAIRQLPPRHRHEIESRGQAGSFLNAFLMGASFGLSWTPCVGLELGAFFLLASQGATIWQGAALLFTFAMGLGVPFILTGIALERLRFFYRYRYIGRHLQKIQLASGLMICLLGALLFLGKMGAISIKLVQLL